MTDRKALAHRRRMLRKAWAWYRRDPVAARDHLIERARKLCELAPRSVWAVLVFPVNPRPGRPT